MKSTYYEIDGGIKFAEEDDYKRGCLPDTAQDSDIRVSFRADTAAGIIEKVKEFHGIDQADKHGAVMLNSCDENGRIDISVMENADGMEASAQELAEFKDGKCRLWSAIYTYKVEKITAEDVDLLAETAGN